MRKVFEIDNRQLSINNIEWMEKEYHCNGKKDTYTKCSYQKNDNYNWCKQTLYSHCCKHVIFEGKYKEKTKIRQLMERAQGEINGYRIEIGEEEIKEVGEEFLKIVNYYKDLSREVLDKSDLALISKDDNGRISIEFSSANNYRDMRSYIRRDGKEDRRFNIVSCYPINNKKNDYTFFNSIRLLKDNESIEGWSAIDVYDMDAMRNPRSVFQSSERAIETAGILVKESKVLELERIMAIIMYYSRKYKYKIYAHDTKEYEYVDVINIINFLVDHYRINTNSGNMSYELIEKENINNSLNLNIDKDHIFYEGLYQNIERRYSSLESQYKKLVEKIINEENNKVNRIESEAKEKVKDRELFDLLFEMILLLLNIVEYKKAPRGDKKIYVEYLELIKDISDYVDSNPRFNHWKDFLYEVFSLRDISSLF